MIGKALYPKTFGNIAPAQQFMAISRRIHYNIAMITFLKGNLVQSGEMPTGGLYVVVDVNGMGYFVHTSSRTLMALPPVNDTLMVYTSLIVREDAMQLVGFLTHEERDLFDILGTASGVGFKVALSLMSHLDVAELSAAIMTGDFKRLTAAKGVGPKLAQKIAIELKEKMSKWREEKASQYLHTGSAADSKPTTQAPAFSEAEAVLISLGYSLDEIYQGLRQIQSTIPDGKSLTSEEILHAVLKWLATHPVH